MRPSLFLILAAGLAWALQAEAGVETRPAGDETTSAALEVLVDTCLPCHYPESSDKKAVRDWPDALDLPAGGMKLGFAIIVHTRFESLKNAPLAKPLDGDDEWETEFLLISVIQAHKRLAFSVGQGIQAGTGLFFG